MSRKLSTLAIGSKIRFGTIYGESIIWLVADKDHTGYPDGSVTLLSEKIIKFMCYDAAEPNSSYPDIQQGGNGRWIYSNIRSWLNSTASAGKWFAKMYGPDEAPDAKHVYHNPYIENEGFLSGFTEKEQEVILNTTISANRCHNDRGGFDSDLCRVFNLSCTEVGWNIGALWGKPLQLFSSTESRTAYPTAQAVNNSDLKRDDINTRNISGWWFRDVDPDRADHACYTVSGVVVAAASANAGSLGLRPALNLPSSLMVSDILDSDGCYTVIYNEAPTVPSSINVPTNIEGGHTLAISWGAASDPDGNLTGYKLERSVNGGGYAQIYSGNACSYTDTITLGWNTVAYRVRAYDAQGAYSGYRTSDTMSVHNNRTPVISGSDRNLGSFTTSPPTVPYNVADADGDTVSVKVYFDDTQVQAYNASLGTSDTLTFQPEEWEKILNGPHKWRIAADDGNGGTAIRIITFEKAVTSISFITATMAADDMPTKAIVNMNGRIADGAVLKIEICNNARDAAPTWEDITQKVISNQKHFFYNRVKTASNWGVALRITVNKGTATETCYITQIGGNFG